MRLISPLIIQIIVTAAYGGDASKVPSEINWSIVEFAFQQLEGGVAGHCKKMVVNVENFTKKVKIGFLKYLYLSKDIRKK